MERVGGETSHFHWEDLSKAAHTPRRPLPVLVTTQTFPQTAPVRAHFIDALLSATRSVFVSVHRWLGSRQRKLCVLGETSHPPAKKYSFSTIPCYRRRCSCFWSCRMRRSNVENTPAVSSYKILLIKHHRRAQMLNDRVKNGDSYGLCSSPKANCVRFWITVKNEEIFDRYLYHVCQNKQQPSQHLQHSRKGRKVEDRWCNNRATCDSAT